MFHHIRLDHFDDDFRCEVFETKINIMCHDLKVLFVISLAGVPGSSLEVFLQDGYS